MKAVYTITFFFCSVCTITACNQNTSNAEKVVTKIIDEMRDSCFIYPSYIDSLKLYNLYDSARWVLFTWHCDLPYSHKKDSIENGKKSFGMLPLIFERSVTKSDTVEFFFNFVDGRDTIMPPMLKKYVYMKNGVAFSLATGEKLYLISPNNYTVQEKGATTRFENPLQPEVIKYIKENLNRLDPCFRQLVEKKGI